ncbi:MAG TPA: hypothetical protein VJ936_08540 [Desulfobacteraceae bacterium]|nr:hypothetical protein [Desulfobacteraceae bacterium]
MNSAALIPAPDIISLDWPWFQFFLIATFVLHLLLMNLMLGSAIIAAVQRWKDRSAPTGIDQPAARRLPFVIAFAVNLGVAPLLFLQVLYGHFMYTSSILMAVYWLSVIGLVILAYYGAYLYAYGPSETGKTLLVSGITLLLLTTGFLFTCNMTLMLTPEEWPAYFENGSGLFLPLTDPTLIPRYLHFVVSAVAVAGLFHAAMGKWKKTPDRADTALGRNGMKWFFYATLVQVPVGFWFFAALPGHVMKEFMGGSPYATALFATGIFAACLCLVFGFKRKTGASVVSLAATVVLMVLIRDALRRAYLMEYFTLDDLIVHQAWSPLLFFIACLAFGAAMVFYMVKLAIQAVHKEDR